MEGSKSNVVERDGVFYGWDGNKYVAFGGENHVANGLEDFSFAERVVGIYDDGRPIYRRTFRQVIDGTTGGKQFPHGIADLGHVIDFKSGHFHQSDGAVSNMPGLGIDMAAGGVFFDHADATDFYGYIGTAFTGDSGLVLVEFTIDYLKTT